MERSHAHRQRTSLSPGELAQWVEDLAYDAWLALPVNKMKTDDLYSFVGTCNEEQLYSQNSVFS